MKFRVLKAWSQDQGANRVDFFWALLLHCGSIFSSYKASSPFGWKPYIYDVSKLNQPLKVLSTITLWEARGLDFKRTGVLIRTKLCPLPNQLTPPLLSIIYVKYACICNLSAIYLSIYLSGHSPTYPSIYRLSIDSTYSVFGYRNFDGYIPSLKYFTSPPLNIERLLLHYFQALLS